jgi:Cof subfamily protein (haloacid dehalogenase superfamily)
MTGSRMTGVRLLALDLDGTVLTPDLRISERTYGAVAAVQARGVRVVLATGRMYRSTLRYAQTLVLPGPLICYQGGYIREMPGADGSPGELLLHRQMPAEAARDAVAWARRHGLDPHINIGDRLIIGRGPVETPDYERMAGVGPEYVSDLVDAIDGPVTKVLAVGPPGLPYEVLEASRTAFDGRLEVTVSHPEYLEFMPLGVTKASGVAFVSHRLGIPMTSVMAIGDQSNDLEMLRDVGFGVAMGDAPAEVKAVADEITGSVDGDGVAEAIERHILGVATR